MLKECISALGRVAGGVVFLGRDIGFDTLALPSRVALQLGFMWGARVPGWDGLGGISGRATEFEGHKTEFWFAPMGNFR